jgi:hypothetical protein
MYRLFVGMYCLHLQGGRVRRASNQKETTSKQGESPSSVKIRASMFLRNVGKVPSVYTSHLRRQYYSPQAITPNTKPKRLMLFKGTVTL